MTGGGDSKASTTTEWVDLNGASPGEDITGSWVGHCAAQMSGDTKSGYYILIGGNGNPKKTLITTYDPKAKKMSPKWIVGPELNGNGRKDHACAYIRHKNVNYVIAVGGNSDQKGFLATSEILNVDDGSNRWYQGEMYNKSMNICVGSNTFCRFKVQDF